MPDTAGREKALAAFPSLLPIAPELEVYEALLKRWQPRINLVGPATLNAIWWRHFADSVQLYDLAPKSRRWCDIGTGAGFPGLVVALALKQDSEGYVDLVESDLRKVAFLREVSRETKAPVEIHASRAEIVVTHLTGVQQVTSRAMTDPFALFRMSSNLFRNGAKGLFLVGEEQATALTAEVSDPSLRWSFHESRTGKGRVLAVERANI